MRVISLQRRRMKPIRLVRRVELFSTWRGGYFYEFFPAGRGVELLAYRGMCSKAEWAVYISRRECEPASLREGIAVASKWITAATVKVKKRTRVGPGTDPVLFAKRPALCDFMSETEGSEGVVRDVSPLMVVTADYGVRVGLKDDPSGGWLWRSADTFTEALDAIERALESGEAKFGIAGSRKGSKGK